MHQALINRPLEAQIVLQPLLVISYPQMPQPDKQNAYQGHTNGTQVKRIVWIHLLENIPRRQVPRQSRIVTQVHSSQIPGNLCVYKPRRDIS